MLYRVDNGARTTGVVNTAKVLVASRTWQHEMLAFSSGQLVLVTWWYIQNSPGPQLTYNDLRRIQWFLFSAQPGPPINQTPTLSALVFSTECYGNAITAPTAWGPAFLTWPAETNRSGLAEEKQKSPAISAAAGTLRHCPSWWVLFTDKTLISAIPDENGFLVPLEPQRETRKVVSWGRHQNPWSNMFSCRLKRSS